MKIGGQPRIKTSNVPDSQYDNFLALVLVEAESFIARALRYGDGLGALCGRLRAERKPILCDSGQGAKQVSVANVSGIVSDAEDEQFFRFGGVRLQWADSMFHPKIT